MAMPTPVYLFARVWYGFETASRSRFPFGRFNNCPDETIEQEVLAFLAETVSGSEHLKGLLELAEQRAASLPDPRPDPSIEQIEQALNAMARTLGLEPSKQTVEIKSLPWPEDVRVPRTRIAKLAWACSFLLDADAGAREADFGAPPVGPSPRIWVGRLEDEALYQPVAEALAESLSDAIQPMIVLGMVREDSLIDLPTSYKIEKKIEALRESPARPRARFKTPTTGERVQACLVEMARCVPDVVEHARRRLAESVKESGASAKDREPGDRASQAAGDGGLGTGANAPSRPPPRSVRAWQEHERATAEDVSITTDKEAYKWLKDQGVEGLPGFLTWSRNLRVARKALGKQKRKMRAPGMQTRSMVTESEADRPRDQES